MGVDDGEEEEEEERNGAEKGVECWWGGMDGRREREEEKNKIVAIQFEKILPAPHKFASRSDFVCLLVVAQDELLSSFSPIEHKVSAEPILFV